MEFFLALRADRYFFYFTWGYFTFASAAIDLRSSSVHFFILAIVLQYTQNEISEFLLFISYYRAFYGSKFQYFTTALIRTNS
jgi:hypothetical protein